jgi:repressor LexA
VRALVEAGLVHDMDGKQRGVRLVESDGPRGVRLVEPKGLRGDDEERTGMPLPLLGRIAAGRPLEAVSSPGMIDVPSHLRSDRPCFVLRVRGDSMIEDGILDGDLVIVEQRDHARNGEIVVALVDGGDATLKRIVQRPGQIELWPANAAMEVMRYSPERVQIQGAVIGQMRSYR